MEILRILNLIKDQKTKKQGNQGPLYLQIDWWTFSLYNQLED